MLPAGQYYIGDLCYVFENDTWDAICDIIFPNEDGLPLDGEFALPDGRRFAIYSTAHGDGSYQDQERNDYWVDSGSIGCVKLEDVDKLEERIKQGSNIVSFNKPFRTYSKDGMIMIGYIGIDTDPKWDDE